MRHAQTRFFRPSILAMAALACGLLAAARAADRPQGNSPLDKERRLSEVAAQKKESEIRAALLEAEKLAASDPAKAAERLTKALAALENDTVLPKARRESLTSMLKSHIKSIEAGPDKKPLTEEQLQSAILRLVKRDDKQAAEQEKVQSGLKAVSDLQKEGKTEEAKRLAEELAGKFPGNPAVKNAADTASAFDQLASAKTVRQDKARAFDRAMRDVDRAAVIPKDDITFGDKKRWQEITKNRAKYAAGVKLTPKERAILAALNSPVTVNFKGEKFSSVIEFLVTALGQPILLDKSALGEANIDYETPVTLSVKGVSARTLLRKILGEFNLTYIVKDETIQVVTEAKARETMTIRSYPVGDLLGDFSGPFGQMQLMQNVAAIIESIQSVDPASWQANGGPGSIFFHAPSMSLVIKQSAEVHAVMSGGGYR